MATKKKAGSKKGRARKKADDDNDPPIIVSGGGGGPYPKKPKPQLPFINVSYDVGDGLGRKTVDAKVDKTKPITGATVTFNQAGVAPVKLTEGPFQITIQFTT